MRKSFHQARQWQIPLDEIKRDKSFVRHIVKRPGDEALTDALVALAHKMNLVVVAEGVETESQLDLLRRQCCD